MIGIVYLIVGALVLFFSGFLLGFLLYGGSQSLDFWERLTVSVGLSALVDMLIVTILAQPPLSALRFLPFIGGVSVFCGVCGVLLFWREESLQTFLDFWSRSQVSGRKAEEAE